MIFETFSSEGPSKFLVVSRARWDEHQRKMSGQKEELRRTPVTLQENSFSSMSERQWQAELDEQRDGWSHFWKKTGDGCNERLPGEVQHCQGGDCGLGALDRTSKLRSACGTS